MDLDQAMDPAETETWAMALIRLVVAAEVAVMEPNEMPILIGLLKSNKRPDCYRNRSHNTQKKHVLNQVSGTVVLRAVFSSSGEVVQIRALRTLPFGLTERAIAAARQIRFVPAVKGGQPVSVAMQLEYNFNLY